MTTRRRPRAARPAARTTARKPNPAEDRTLSAILAAMNRLPKPYRRIPQPWHFLLKLATVAVLVYLFWGFITAAISALLSLLFLLAFTAFTIAVLVGSLKYSTSAEGRREEERWYEENDPRGNGPRGAI